MKEKCSNFFYRNIHIMTNLCGIGNFSFFDRSQASPSNPAFGERKELNGAW